MIYHVIYSIYHESADQVSIKTIIVSAIGFTDGPSVLYNIRKDFVIAISHSLMKCCRTI